MVISQYLRDKRRGYRLTEEAYEIVSWTEDNPCYCSACSCPPCSSCENGCSEETAYEIDEMWEVDPDYEEVVDVARDNIVDKSIKKEIEYKSGDKVRIIGNSNSHCHNINDIVFLTHDRSPSGAYGSTKVLGTPKVKAGWLKAEDFELVETIKKPTKGLTPFERAGYNKDTKFKVIKRNPYFDEGVILSLFTDDSSNAPKFTDGKNSYYMGLPGMDASKLEVVKEETSKPKSEWFGYKYKVTPETSKLLQEAVFKDGGRWEIYGQEVIYLNSTVLYVYEDGKISHGWIDQHFREHRLPEKQPPSVDKQDNSGVGFKVPKSIKGTPITVLEAVGMCHGVVSETPSIEDTVNRIKEEISLAFKKQSSNFNQQEGNNMSNVRRIVQVQVFDNDPALEVEYSLVHVFKDVLTEDDDNTTIQELLHTGGLVEPLKKHNANRVKQTNKEIQDKTGQKVALEAVKVKNLKFVVKS